MSGRLKTGKKETPECALGTCCGIEKKSLVLRTAVEKYSKVVGGQEWQKKF
jgi:hypothetical protein